jgi:hypothetical protein
MVDTTRQIRYSEDHGNNWNTVKVYPDNDSLIFYYDLINKGRKIVVMHFYRESDSTCFFEAMDLISHAITPVYSYKIKQSDPWEGKIHAAFDSDSGIVYFAVEDTLFYTDDIYDRQNWKYILFPKGGAIKKTFKKFGDKFFARYSDDLRGDNIYWINIPYADMYPKKLISTLGYDFGKVDIMATSSAIQNLKIVNLSDKAVLKVQSCSGFNDPSFSAVLPVMDANNPLIITPGEYYEYQVSFKPESVKFYRDSLIFSSDAEGLDSIAVFTGEGIDTTTSVVEYEIEIEPYLFAFPPYPLPARTESKVLLYWDTGSDIDDASFVAYDIYGSKINGKEKFTLEKRSKFSGELSWDCSGVPSGVYIIFIQHGAKTIVIKTIIAKE